MCVKLALSAVNMAESANHAISCKEILEIYLNVVVMLRVKFGAYSRLLMVSGLFVLYRDSCILVLVGFADFFKFLFY